MVTPREKKAIMPGWGGGGGGCFSRDNIDVIDTSLTAIRPEKHPGLTMSSTDF